MNEPGLYLASERAAALALSRVVPDHPCG